MSDGLKPPIIVLGNTRSGTTVVQNVISAHRDVVGWYEPRTLWLMADPRRRHDEFDEGDATEPVKRYIRRQFLKYQRQHGDRIVLEKTPANILKIPYVHAVLPEAHYLFIVRDPFSFISSNDLAWQHLLSPKGIRRRLASTPVTQLPYYAGQLVAQQFRRRVLKKRYLGPYGPRYRGMDEDLKTLDRLTVIARQWAVCSQKAEDALARFEPGRVLRLRYESFVENPVAEAERICRHCGLDMTEEVLRVANEHVKSDRQMKWQRFEPGELARLLPELLPEMRRHGYRVPQEVAAASGTPLRAPRPSFPGELA